MKTKQVFDFKCYYDFLNDALDSASQTQRGVRGKFAQHVQCQPSYLSRVLRRAADLTLEQADRANRFFHHTPEQSSYFLLLVEHARAGTQSLKDQIQWKIHQEHSTYWSLRNRLANKDEMSDDAKQIFFSSWQYAAISIALTVPELRTIEKISARLQIGADRVAEVLDFLCAAGLAKKNGPSYSPGNDWWHYGEDRTIILRDHFNWRVKTIYALENLKPTDLHYTSVISISRADFELIRAKLVSMIEEARVTIKKSKEEKVCGLLLDFFEL